MYSLNGICNLSRKELVKALKTENGEIKYVILLLYDESHEATCERFLENYAAIINNKTNYQIAFLTRYSETVLNSLSGQIGFNEIKKHYSKHDGKLNSYEIMRYWARRFDDIEFVYGKNIASPTFVIISSNEGSNPIIFPSKCNVNILKNNFERIINVIWKNYTNFPSIEDDLNDIIDSRQVEKKSDFELNYELFYFVDDKRNEAGCKWESLNRYLGYSYRSSLQDKLKHNRINKMQLITIGFILNMNKDEINEMLFLRDEDSLSDKKEFDIMILECLDRNYERCYSIRDKIEQIQSELNGKLPINLDDIYD